jgi:hypothetical protein
VRSADARSAGIDRPDGVTRTFQVSRYKVEPREARLACNLFPKADVRAALADEPKEIGPEVARVIERESESGVTEGSTGTTARPDRSVVRPSGLPKGVGPDPDAGEEMALGVFGEIAGLHFSDASFIYVSRRNQVAHN